MAKELSSFSSYETYRNERLYRYTTAYTEKEWNEHLFRIWKALNKGLREPRKREYTVVTKEDVSFVVKAESYMAAKLVASQTHNIPISDIKTVL